MRKILIALSLLISLTAIAGNARQESYTIETVPNVYVRDARQHVSDPGALLSAEARTHINRLFTALEDSTGIQAMVVMLPSIGDAVPFDFAQDLFRHWGIGDKERNDGLLILYVADQRHVRFHTGYGIEGTLPDALCKRIQSEFMLPHFRRGDTDSGMVAGAEAAVQLLTADAERPAGADEEDNPYLILLIFLVIIAIGGYFIWHGDRVHRTCKACKRPAALRLMSKDLYYDDQRCKHLKEIFICNHCGHVEVRDRIIEHPDDGKGNSDLISGIAMGAILGSMMGGRSSGGGGYSGGSFGGGSSGGGGAGSSW